MNVLHMERIISYYYYYRIITIHRIFTAYGAQSRITLKSHIYHLIKYKYELYPFCFFLIHLLFSIFYFIIYYNIYMLSVQYSYFVLICDFFDALLYGNVDLLNKNIINKTF